MVVCWFISWYWIIPCWWFSMLVQGKSSTSNNSAACTWLSRFCGFKITRRQGTAMQSVGNENRSILASLPVTTSAEPPLETSDPEFTHTFYIWGSRPEKQLHQSLKKCLSQICLFDLKLKASLTFQACAFLTGKDRISRWWWSSSASFF